MTLEAKLSLLGWLAWGVSMVALLAWNGDLSDMIWL